MTIKFITRLLVALLWPLLPSLLPSPPMPMARMPTASQAKADGVCNITTDSPWYSAKLDRDGDGYACEC